MFVLYALAVMVWGVAWLLFLPVQLVVWACGGSVNLLGELQAAGPGGLVAGSGGNTSREVWKRRRIKSMHARHVRASDPNWAWVRQPMEQIGPQ